MGPQCMRLNLASRDISLSRYQLSLEGQTAADYVAFALLALALGISLAKCCMGCQLKLYIAVSLEDSSSSSMML